MTGLILVTIDYLVKIFFQPVLFFALPFILIFFLKADKNFFSTFLLFSFLNDLFFNLYLGLTGIILGAFFIFIIILKKFISLEGKNIIFVFNFLLLLVFLGSLFYFLKLYSFEIFAKIFLVNFLLSTFILFIYRIFF